MIMMMPVGWLTYYDWAYYLPGTFIQKRKGRSEICSESAVNWCVKGGSKPGSVAYGRYSWNIGSLFHTATYKIPGTQINELDPSAILQQPESLLSFAGNPRRHMHAGLPFKYTDYLELVDWTGRILRDDKRGAILAATPEILSRLNIDKKHRFI